jgi:hypothetical protein
MRPAALVGLALVLGGCGSPPADLFEVQRSGADRNANLTMVVSDGGQVTCNGTKHELPPQQLLTARDLTRRLSKQAQLNLDLPAGPGSVLRYKVRMEAGTLVFADTSRDLPRPLQQLAAFTKDVSEDVCGLQRR